MLRVTCYICHIALDRMEKATPANKRDALRDRLVDFAVRIVLVSKALPKSTEGRHVGRQILRAGTSPGANFEEACGAESHADFTHKVGIVLKELKETRYWLRVARRVPLANL